MKRSFLVLILLLTACNGAQPAAQSTNTSAPPTQPPSMQPSSTPTAVKPTSTIVVPTETNPPPGPIHVIFDDDGSRDGTAALLFLLARPELSIDAINTSYGEAHPAVYAQYVGRMLDLLGIQNIPLGVGQDASLGGGIPFPDFLRNLSNNFWNFPLENEGKTYPTRNAPELMVETINQSSEPVTIFMSGTFTTLAQALRLDPGIEEKIAAVYIMGGAVYVPGNITNLIPDSSNKVAEWNILADPQAAKEVLESNLDMYLVPLDSTNQVMLTLADIQPWENGNAYGKLTAQLYEIVFNEYGWQQAEIFDQGAAVIMVAASACDFQPLHLEVITEAGDTLGQTVVINDNSPNINVCLDPDAELIKHVLSETFMNQ